MQKHLVRPQFATGFQKAPFGRRTNNLKRVVELLTVLRTEWDVLRQLPTKDSVLSSLQHRRPQLRKARAHGRRYYRASLSRALSEARRGAHSFPGMNLTGASTRQERRCSAPFGVPLTSLRIDQNKKKLLKRSRAVLYFLPTPNFSRESVKERQQNPTRGSSKFLSAAFYPHSIRYFRYFRYKVFSGGDVPA